ncbi:hypothetical protein BC830DRAFT_769461 [Chytriomyces sp. MP71]|nr:hypothetical protein BC830DRAFT_769461 [Chytriomyces sp. MP71]
MTDSISELLENSLQRVSDRLTIDAVREEILLHSRIFSDSANSFTGKTRLVNKVLAFFLRRYRYGIPPFLVNGPLGNASTNLLCKGFQKFLDDAVPLVFANRISLTSDSPSFPISIVRFVGASPDSSNTVTLLKSICRQIKRAFTALLTPSQLTENPIYSSPVHDPDYLPGDFSSLSTYFLDLLAHY